MNLLSSLAQACLAKLQATLSRHYQICVCQEALERVESYEEWRLLAKQLDKLEGHHQWKKTAQSSLYDANKIQSIINQLRKLREDRDPVELMSTIRQELIKNKGNSANPVLYQRVHYGTKKLVVEYYHEVIKGLLYVATARRLPLFKKLEFFSQARHAYGRTALMLSGGASNGVYHYGLIRTLYQQDLLPRIICGSSAGSLVAAFICTTPYEDLGDILSSEESLLFHFVEHAEPSGNPLARLLFYLKKGYFLKAERLFTQMRELVGEVTFQEAFDRYKWVLNITVCGEQQEDDSLMLNYLSAPNVLICSAAAASCAVPSVFQPVALLCKNSRGQIVPYRQDGTRFVDGSVWQDLPLERMSQLFNINTFIVSQVNPYVIPFLAYSDGGGVLGQGHRDTWLTIIRQFCYEETAHRIRQLDRAGLVPAFLRRALNIFIQNYRGTVTVCPQPRLQDYLSLLKNPTLPFIRYASRHMARATYSSKCALIAELALIRAVFGIEHELDRFYQNLKSQMARLQAPQTLNPIVFEEYEDEEEVDPLAQRQEEIAEQTRNMCLVSLVKNPYLQIENNHRRLRFKRDASSGSKPSFMDSVGSQLSLLEQRTASFGLRQLRGESPASGMGRRMSFADSESQISEEEVGGSGRQGRIGSFLMPRTATYEMIVKEERGD